MDSWKMTIICKIKDFEGNIINASINYENYNIIILGNILKFRLIK